MIVVRGGLVMAETIDYEALRARHAADPPLRALTDQELEALTDAGVAELRDLSFLARLELGARRA